MPRPALIRREASFRVAKNDLVMWSECSNDTQYTYSRLLDLACQALEPPLRVVPEWTVHRIEDSHVVYNCWAEWTDDPEARRVDNLWETRP